MTELIGNLKTESPPIYHLYLMMKEQLPGKILVEEIAVISEQTIFDQKVAAVFVSKVASTNKSFNVHLRGKLKQLL